MAANALSKKMTISSF